MTATVIPFPFNDKPRSDTQREHVLPATVLMEAWEIYEAAGLWIDACNDIDRTTAVSRMLRMLEHGSPAAREMVIIWRDNVLGAPPPAPVPVDCDPFEGSPDSYKGAASGSDYSD